MMIQFNYYTTLSVVEAIINRSHNVTMDKSASPANFFTSTAGNAVVTAMRRKEKKGRKVEQVIPLVAKEYTELGIGHVDAFDAHLS